MTKEKKLLQRMIALVLIAAILWQTDSMRFFSTAYAAETGNLSDDNSNVLKIKIMPKPDSKLDLNSSKVLQSFYKLRDKYIESY